VRAEDMISPEAIKAAEDMASLERWDRWFLDMAEFVSGKSKDPSTKCGAVITRPDHTVVSMGYNGFPRGVEETYKTTTFVPVDSATVVPPAVSPPFVVREAGSLRDDRWEQRPEKYMWVEHAERNAVYNAARIGAATEGCTMYVNQSIICCDCARAIIQAGITRVVTPAKEWTGHSDGGFKETADIMRTMFREAGVTWYEVQTQGT